MCVELSWPNAKATFVGTNSNCASVNLNGVDSLPTKQLEVDLGDSLTYKLPGEKLEATITLRGKLINDLVEVQVVYTVK